MRGWTGENKNMKKVLTLCAIAALAGCARFHTTQTDYSYDPTTGTPQRKVTTKTSAYTLFSARSALTTWKAKQDDKSQGADVGGLVQSSENPATSNIVAAVVGAAVKAAAGK
jgi:outer membrane lipoprotein SlyB